jgi:2-isopropylmalate synthase
MDTVKIYDTTLRDGMQAEGVSFSLEDKVRIAVRLDEFGVDYIEGGYAASNQKEMEFFSVIRGKKLKNSKVVAFGSTRRADKTVEEDMSLSSMLQCGASAGTLVGKAWDMHVTEVLGCSFDENLVICDESVKYLKSKGLEVIFDAEHFFDGYKANPDYSIKVLQAAANAGADALVLCDTNGGWLPQQIFDVVTEVKKQLAGAVLGIHTHNDTDCAVANSMAAVSAGCSHVQGTINGMGERTGNANLCTLIPNLAYKMKCDVMNPESLKKLTEISRFVFEISNLNPIGSMPYVGESAFAHKAGLHVNALRKNQTTYEHILPEDVGNKRRFLISELSGKSNILAKISDTKITEDKKLVQKILERVQELENDGYQFEAADASFHILVQRSAGVFKPSFELVKYHVNTEQRGQDQSTTEATVKLKVDGLVEHVVGEGDGPVNALDHALRKSLNRFYPNLKDMRLFDYKVRVVNARAGTAARVRVVIESRDKDSMWGTVGVSENVIDASWLALVDSIEYKLSKDKKTGSSD